MRKKRHNTGQGKTANDPSESPNFLDLNNLPSMDELLNGITQDRASSSISVRQDAEKDCSDIQGISSRGELKEKRTPRPGSTAGGLNLTDMPSMEELLRKGRTRSSSSRVGSADEVKRDAVYSEEGRNGDRRRKGNKRNISSAIKHLPSMVVIDGSNVCRQQYNLNGFGGEGASSLSLLLELALFLVQHKVCFRCLFDASEKFSLGRNSRWPRSMTVYLEILRHAPALFSEVPSGQSADDLILQLANQYNCPVISNDRFNKSNDTHLEKYPWLTVANKRLIRAELDPVGRVYWPLLGLRVESGDIDPYPLGGELLALI